MKHSAIAVYEIKQWPDARATKCDTGLMVLPCPVII